MRKPLLAIWVAIPLAAWAYHEGPGQEQLKRDAVDVAVYRADEALADEDWHAAISEYEQALADLPANEVATERRLRLSIAQAKMESEQLIEARSEVAKLVEELTADEDANPALLAEARRTHARAQYYYTWLMRLEGYQRPEWEPEIEVARQTYRLLAEQAVASGDADKANTYREDLESAVLLARLELEELQGLPLPSQ